MSDFVFRTDAATVSETITVPSLVRARTLRVGRDGGLDIPQPDTSTLRSAQYGGTYMLNNGGEYALPTAGERVPGGRMTFVAQQLDTASARISFYFPSTIHVAGRYSNAPYTSSASFNDVVFAVFPVSTLPGTTVAVTTLSGDNEYLVEVNSASADSIVFEGVVPS